MTITPDATTTSRALGYTIICSSAGSGFSSSASVSVTQNPASSGSSSGGGGGAMDGLLLGALVASLAMAVSRRRRIPVQLAD